jgi:tRNA A37 threonylcarbamoyladenosine biosynthesis protein TsaE
VKENEIPLLGLDEILAGDNLVFIEWATKLPPKYRQDETLTIHIKVENEQRRYHVS